MQSSPSARRGSSRFCRKSKPGSQFNRTYREQVLDAYLFGTLDEVRTLTGRWVAQYNGERPHRALGRQTPLDYQAAHQRRSAKELPAQKAG